MKSAGDTRRSESSRFRLYLKLDAQVASRRQVPGRANERRVASREARSFAKLSAVADGFAAEGSTRNCDTRLPNCVVYISGFLAARGLVYASFRRGTRAPGSSDLFSARYFCNYLLEAGDADWAAVD